jgi:hypothetical protein
VKVKGQPEVLQDRRGWLDTTQYQLKDQSHSFGTNTYFLYVFPAVRLALIAAGKEYGQHDPAAHFMKGRIQVNTLLGEHRRVLSTDYPIDHDRQQEALTAFKRQLEDAPFDERLWQSTGSLLLRIRYCSKERLMGCKNHKSRLWLAIIPSFKKEG